MDINKLTMYIENLLDNNLIKNNDRIRKNIEVIQKRAINDEFRIAVVGEFSSGKSTFINGLIGKDILKHATIETTATVTYIHNVKSNHELYGMCKVNFYNGNCKTFQDYENLIEYTTTISEMDVVNTISSVEIFINFIDIYENLVIVDTPGLNGVADKHREVTIDEIQKADACIYLFQKNGITNSDKEFIRFLCNYQNTFLFVQNFIDELKASENELIEDKLSLIKNYLDKNIFEENNFKINYTLYGISALKALVGKDDSINKLYDDDLFELNSKRRKEILIESNIVHIENRIKELVNSEGIKNIRYMAISHALCNLLQEVLEKEKLIQERNNKLIVNDKAYKNKEVAQKNIDKLLNNQNEMVTKLENLVKANFLKGKKLLGCNIEEKFEVIQLKIFNLIDEENNYNNFDEKFKNKFYVNELQKLIDQYKAELEEYEYCVIQDVYKNMLNRLNEYSNYSIKEVNKTVNIHFNETNKKEFDLSFKENKQVIEDLKSKLYDNKKNKDYTFDNLMLLENSMEKNKELLDTSNCELKEVDEKYIIDKNKLGSRPEKELEGYDEVVKYVPRGGLGIAQFFLGDKKVTKLIPRYSDEKGYEWERKIRELSTKYHKDRDRLQREVIRLTEKKDKIEQDIDKNKFSMETSERNIVFLSKQIKVKEEELKIYETKAKKEYLETRKNYLKKDINKYLFEGDKANESIKNIFKEKMLEDINSNEIKIQEETKKEWDSYIVAEKNRLEAIINNNLEKLNKEYTINAQYIQEIEKMYCELYNEIENLR